MTKLPNDQNTEWGSRKHQERHHSSHVENAQMKGKITMAAGSGQHNGGAKLLARSLKEARSATVGSRRRSKWREALQRTHNEKIVNDRSFHGRETETQSVVQGWQLLGHPRWRHGLFRVLRVLLPYPRPHSPLSETHNPHSYSTIPQFSSSFRLQFSAQSSL